MMLESALLCVEYRVRTSCPFSAARARGGPRSCCQKRRWGGRGLWRLRSRCIGSGRGQGPSRKPNTCNTVTRRFARKRILQLAGGVGAHALARKSLVDFEKVNLAQTVGSKSGCENDSIWKIGRKNKERVFRPKNKTEIHFARTRSAPGRR